MSGSFRGPAPGDQVAKRDSGARRANSGRASAQPGSLPSSSGETRRALRVRPSLEPVSPDFGRDPDRLPPSAPRARNFPEEAAPCWPPPHFPSRRGPGAARAVAPAPRKETGAPTHRGASLALPRVPMAAAALQEPPHPARRDRLGGVRRIATTPCRAPPPRPPLPGRPTAANPQAQTLCERAPRPPPWRARAHTPAPTT